MNQTVYPNSSAREEELLARVLLSRLVEPGDRQVAALVQEHGAINLSKNLDSWFAPKDVQRYETGEATKDIETAVRHNLTAVLPGDEQWPASLDDIEAMDPLGPAAPLMLWVRGDAKLLTSDSLAVVGSRACTSYGAHITAEVATYAAERGVAIISGAAYGVDAAAHRAALTSNERTVAVLACGADRVYPAAHNKLLDQIADNGCVVSELRPGGVPTRHRFIMRSRIIAALSKATIVTEAGTRSGALRAAKTAHGMGRPVGAVPGPVTSAASAGCHRLIQDSTAHLITNGEEALSLFTDVPSVGQNARRDR